MKNILRGTKLASGAPWLLECGSPAAAFSVARRGGTRALHVSGLHVGIFPFPWSVALGPSVDAARHTGRVAQQ
jgi:hypothetical protein